MEPVARRGQPAAREARLPRRPACHRYQPRSRSYGRDARPASRAPEARPPKSLPQASRATGNRGDRDARARREPRQWLRATLGRPETHEAQVRDRTTQQRVREHPNAVDLDDDGRVTDKVDAVVRSRSGVGLSSATQFTRTTVPRNALPGDLELEQARNRGIVANLEAVRPRRERLVGASHAHEPAAPSQPTPFVSSSGLPFGAFAPVRSRVSCRSSARRGISPRTRPRADDDRHRRRRMSGDPILEGGLALERPRCRRPGRATSRRAR